jgi:hypothetical protein
MPVFPKGSCMLGGGAQDRIFGVQCPGRHRPFFRASHTRIRILWEIRLGRNIPEGKILEILSTFLFCLLSFLSFNLILSSLFLGYTWQLLGYNIGGMVVLLTTFWDGKSWKSYVLVWRVLTVVTRFCRPFCRNCPASVPTRSPSLRPCTNYNILSKRFWTHAFPQDP